jgi:predicted RNA binding protein YcfA (HicA-like mRNA interferase family)
MIKFLERQGYSIIRIRGSHHVMRSGDHWTTIPVHGSRALKIGTLRKILRDVEMSPLEFEQRWLSE